MWKLKFTSQFKKDYKRIQNQPEKLKALDAVLSALAATGTVPQEYLPHPLSGNFAAGFLQIPSHGGHPCLWL